MITDEQTNKVYFSEYLRGVQMLGKYQRSVA